jgi:uncharacterized protein YrrD
LRDNKYIYKIYIGADVNGDAGNMLQGMKRGSLLGLPVISARTGKKLGVVVDIIFKPSREKIEGLLISKEGLMERKNHIPLEQIRTIGRHAVIIDDVQSDTNKTRNIVLSNKGEYGNQILGRQLLRGDGQELGHVSDIILNPNDGSVEGFEISRGVIDDLLDGRYILPYDASNSISGDAIIVSAEQTQQIQSYNRGIKGLFDTKQ